MIDFGGLATAAALGTATRPVAAADLPEPILALFGDPTGISGHDPAEVLLDAAAGYALVRRSRIPPGPDLPALEIPAADREEAPEAVVSLLHRIAGAGVLRDPLQREALAALAARRLTLPHDLMLLLLAEVHRPEIARDVAGLLDDRWRALVALDPVWTKALGAGAVVADPADPRVWLEGTAGQRAEHLAAIRRSDPVAGRSLIEGPEFARETAETRALLMRQLQDGLGEEDAALLETALDDRARGVREVAAALLAQLPGSAYIARAEALAATNVHPTKRLLRRALTVVEPVAVTAATRRDLYRQRDPENLPAERLHLLDVLGIVPTDRWPALVGATATELATGPAEYVGAPIDLRPAFAVAALRWRDADLAAALCRSDPALAPSLLPVLAPAVRERLLVDALAAQTGTKLVGQVVQGWMSPPVALAALELLSRLTTHRDQVHQVGELLVALGVHADPLAAPALVDRLRRLDQSLPDKPPPALHRAIGTASTALQLRQALSEALLPYPPLPSNVDPKG